MVVVFTILVKNDKFTGLVRLDGTPGFFKNHHNWDIA